MPLRSGYLKKGRTLAELAEVCGIDPRGLEETIAEFNDHARRGLDPRFGRGSTPFNRYGGDPTVGPNPSLAPVETGPFYAVRIVPGSFGTFAGLATDARARVLNHDDRPVAGLYAVGNDQVSVMGGHYPAGGINIGPAMAFGYVAGRDLAGVAAPVAASRG
jgi:succinate dehydrogenase/fumarate reductase flavoprotein subunit